MAKSILVLERLKELFSYDGETGLFTRLVTVGNNVEGKIAGAVRPRDGYIQISIDRTMHQAHRLAWFYVNGTWPAGEIDHVNGIPSDNRICNLRDVSRLQNMQNIRRPTTRNKSGLLGVSKFGDYELWRSRLVVSGKLVCKYFKTPELAHEHYMKTKKELHPFSSIA